MQRIGKIEAATMQLRQEKPRQNKEEKLTKKQPEKSTGKFDELLKFETQRIQEKLAHT